MKVEIKSRWNGSVLYMAEANSLSAAVIAAAKARAYLRDADLGGADLVGAYLRGADLGSAYLRDADLGGAYLRDADLGGANLVGANLVGANLVGADLVGANLVGADLRGADLGSAYLRDANLGGANLVGANLVGANLVGANLVGADLGGAKLKDAVIEGTNAVVQISPIGSRDSMLTVFRTDKGLRLQTGCFYGDADTFLVRVMDTHGTNRHATNYRNALELAASMLGASHD